MSNKNKPTTAKWELFIRIIAECSISLLLFSSLHSNIKDNNHFWIIIDSIGILGSIIITLIDILAFISYKNQS
ncbi:hypothetical protein [Tepidibacter mesophilus]|uniref:hypothetical protein n=1 Tax=Tepidibacter mesophilus TaxID=655607 RepID=UPI000C06B42D|nr:hypothetical protein [Tepidibacter mesophilus]